MLHCCLHEKVTYLYVFLRWSFTCVSGRKSIDLLAGATSVLRGAIRATGEVVVAGTEVGIAALEVAQAYAAKQQREKEKAKLRQQRVEAKREKLRVQAAKKTESKVVVKLPVVTASSSPGDDSTHVAKPQSTQSGFSQDVDAQRQAELLASRLPRIQREYQSLIDQQVLDNSTVQQALKGAEKALSKGELSEAEAHLQALDEARIQVGERLKFYWQPQVQYAQARLDAIRPSVPSSAVNSIHTKLQDIQRSWQQLVEDDLTDIHKQISELEEQSDRIQEATKNLLKAWQDEGYTAQFLAYDNGDAIIEVDTHEEASTQMRVQFNGQGLDLLGPPEDTPACAARTKDALRRFQEQGYYVEWNALDGEAVSEDLRRYYSATAPVDAAIAQPTEESSTEVLTQQALSTEDSPKTITPANKPKKRVAEGS